MSETTETKRLEQVAALNRPYWDMIPASDRRRRTRELAMQMAIQAGFQQNGEDDLVRAAKIIGDFLEGDAA